VGVFDPVRKVRWRGREKQLEALEPSVVSSLERQLNAQLIRSRGFKVIVCASGEVKGSQIAVKPTCRRDTDQSCKFSFDVVELSRK
jgi:hypothetical protein